MSRWNYVNGNFLPTTNLARPTPLSAATTTTSPASVTTSSSTHSHVDLDKHFFAQIKDFVAENAVLERATENSEHVMGVVTTSSLDEVTVVHSGITYAWVTLGPVTPPLSGIYEKLINGVFAGNVVIDVHGDRSFTMCQTHDDDLTQLRQRFDALTTTT